MSIDSRKNDDGATAFSTGIFVDLLLLLLFGWLVCMNRK